MKAFGLAELQAQRTADGAAYLEFLRERHYSVGLYELPAGGADPQSPHTEDEVYVVLRGQARITVAGEASDVEAGSVVHVDAGVEHRFVDITADLAVVVLFAPPERDPAVDPLG